MTALSVFPKCREGKCTECPGETRRSVCTHGCHAEPEQDPYTDEGPASVLDPQPQPEHVPEHVPERCTDCGAQARYLIEGKTLTIPGKAGSLTEFTPGDEGSDTAGGSWVITHGPDCPTGWIDDEPLPPDGLGAESRQYGGDPSLVADEVADLLRADMAAHPRSAQVEIGASEIGTPCRRKLAAKLGGLPEVNIGESWGAYVGTVMHANKAAVLERDNERWIANTGHPRWVVEAEVEIGEFGNGRKLVGHCDAYDVVTAGVPDWKYPCLTNVRKMHSQGPGQTYRVQAHCYGYGHARLGRRVDWVGILAIPTSGSLAQRYFWSEPYDESVALQALQTAHQVTQMIDTMGAERIARMAAPVEDHCEYCPFYSPVEIEGKFTCQGGAGFTPRSPRTPPREAFG